MTTSSSLARRPTTAERVLTLLAEQGGVEGLTRADIARALSVPHGTVDRAVIALLERGAAHKANDGLPGRCPARVIARELGVERATVRRDLRRLGLRAGEDQSSDPGTVPSGRDRAFHDALWAHVEHLHLRGLSDTQSRSGARRLSGSRRFPGHFPHFAELGIDGRAHALRHRFGTETYRASRDIRVVQELLGHASPQTTAGYAAYSRQGRGRRGADAGPDEMKGRGARSDRCFWLTGPAEPEGRAEVRPGSWR